MARGGGGRGRAARGGVIGGGGERGRALRETPAGVGIGETRGDGVRVGVAGALDGRLGELGVRVEVKRLMSVKLREVAGIGRKDGTTLPHPKRFSGGRLRARGEGFCVKRVFREGFLEEGGGQAGFLVWGLGFGVLDFRV